MKKLGKILINPEKVIKNEELVNLSGGYGGHGTCSICYCFLGGSPIGPAILGSTTPEECYNTCHDRFGADDSYCY